GLDWSLQRERYLVELGFYPLGDLHGDNDGRTWDARLAWIPRRAHDKVWHIGASWSEERLASRMDGRGQRISPSVRWQSRPEVGLLATRLIDTGTIDRVQAIRRAGLEALWIEGPLSIQAEYLHTRVRRHGPPSFTGRGYYVFGSYVLTGESRPYRDGQVANPNARNKQAVELLLRYSALDLNDGAIAGGREHNMTAGANWYPNDHWKLQINQIFVHAKRRGLRTDDRILALQVQFHF
ncbi:MAG TPA: porin, partial [Dyella sp.]|uniref:OprO/OprP family phosphate-selective porin n=1 Tax=Dyella sp. TaxID=1869338 RepID=UPI002F928DEB